MSRLPHDPRLPVGPAPVQVLDGWFRFTRWSNRPGETFAKWQRHFEHLGVRTRLVHEAGMTALYREGTEELSNSGQRERCRKTLKNVDTP